VKSTLSNISSLTCKDLTCSQDSEESALTEEAEAAAAAALASKKSQATSKEVQRKHSIKAKQHSHWDKLAMTQATVLIKWNQDLSIGHPKKVAIVEIVRATNERLNANISAKTAVEYVRNGLIGGVLPLC
jgi:hypothetical protein